MERVTGIGGVFFRSKDAVALGKWYEAHLGINPVPQTMEDTPWQTTGGTTVFAPFPGDTSYFASDKSFMINFRVTDLDALIAQLEAADIAVKRLPDMPGLGSFAHLTDPEGTPIELWQPATA